VFFFKNQQEQIEQAEVVFLVVKLSNCIGILLFFYYFYGCFINIVSFIFSLVDDDDVDFAINFFFDWLVCLSLSIYYIYTHTCMLGVSVFFCSPKKNNF